MSRLLLVCKCLCTHKQSLLADLFPTFSCTNLANVLALEFSVPAGGNGRCNHRPQMVDTPCKNKN